MGTVIVKRAGIEDISDVAEMCHCLWPDADITEHAGELEPLLAGRTPGSLPAAIMVAEQEGSGAVGFVWVGLRSHADGCDPSRPVCFIEGWFVKDAFRRQGVGGKLIDACEEWARTQGCHEMASDTWIDNMDSQAAHEALGFEVVDKCVHYRRTLRPLD